MGNPKMDQTNFTGENVLQEPQEFGKFGNF